MNQTHIISGIFIKQLKDISKNMSVLVLFIIFPIIGFILTKTIGGSMGASMDQSFFLSIFASIHCIFTPITTTSTIIAEEKEMNTLRVLILSNVKPVQYLFSIGGFVYLATMLSSIPFFVMGGYTGPETVVMLLFLSIGTICSITVGMAIGSYASNMSAANGLAVPVGMFFGFLPMLSFFNPSIMKFAKYTFGVQISNIIKTPNLSYISVEVLLIILINFLLFLGIFIIIYKKNAFDN